MLTKRLTVQSLASLSKKDGAHTDGAGLRLRVSGNGSHCSWVLRLTINGKMKDIGLGSYPEISLKAARLLADGLRRKAALGLPLEEEKEPEIPTFEGIYKEAVQNQKTIKNWTNPKAEAQWYSTLETYALPVIGAKKVDEITRDDILAILKPIWGEKSSTALKVKGRIEMCLDYCKAKGWRDGENPAAWKGNLALFLPSRDIANPVVHFAATDFETLRDTVVPKLLSAITPNTAAILFGILTGLRAQEFLRTLWSEIDWKDKVFTVPWTRLKCSKRTKLPHRVPLSDQALWLLEQMKGKNDEVVFPGRIARFLSIDSPRVTLQRIVGDQITMHGMRSVFRDWCERNGVRFQVAEKCLAHGVGDKTVAAYQRDDLLEERRKVMQAWADALFRVPGSNK